MPIATLLTRLESESRDRVARDPVVRAQLALVRTLLDESERRPRSSPSLGALREQLREELERLQRMLADAGPEPSGIHLRGPLAERPDRSEVRRREHS